jgi:hypothetical protein
VRTIEAFGLVCLGVNVISIWSGVGDFSALSWESVEVMYVLTISSIFCRG